MGNIIFWASLGASSGIGLLVGIIRGFTGAKSWAGEYVLSVLITVLVGSLLAKGGTPASVAGIITIACAVVCLLAFVGLSALTRKILNHVYEKREGELKEGRGFAGVFDRILGGITLALKGFVLSAVFVLCLFAFLDLCKITAVTNLLTSTYDGAFWAWVKPYIFDLIVIGLIQASIRFGFSGGIISSCWSIAVLGMLVGAGFLSHHLVFGLTLFETPANQLGSAISGWLSSFPVPEGIGVTVARWIIFAAVFIVFAIIIAVISFFVSRILQKARFNTAFYIVDGILGGFVAAIICIALLLVFGNLLQSLYVYDFMNPLKEYLEHSSTAVYVCGKNVLAEFGLVLVNIPAPAPEAFVV